MVFGLRENGRKWVGKGGNCFAFVLTLWKNVGFYKFEERVSE